MTRGQEFLKPMQQKLDRKDDVEHFLEVFDGIAMEQGWTESAWVIQLVGLLTG